MTRVLGLGKVTKEVFNRSVLPFIPIQKPPELDGATINLSGDTVISHSPSIGVPIEAVGFFAFHYSASNVASKFGKPKHLISGIYLPLNTKENELRTIAKNLGDEARKYGVSITAGQTAVYSGLEIPLLTATCLGESIRVPEKVCVGDKVLLVGEVGGEALWLDKLSKGEKSDMWRGFTPLPVILNLQKISGVKLMHDVSEGGVKGALYEVATSNSFGLQALSEDIIWHPGAEELLGDIFRAPTYGVLIVIAASSAVESIQLECKALDLSSTIIGEVTQKWGLNFDNQSIEELPRIKIDEIYGSYDKK